MTTDLPLDRPLDRRFLIRGGAVLASAAGATALGAALAPTKAAAADGANVVLGAENNASETPTVITIDGAAGGAEPTLVLNNANGPSLALQPLSENFDGPLAVGEIANTVVGPNIGVDYGDGPATTFLATGADLFTPFPLPPERVLDRQFKSGEAVDVAIRATADVDLVGVFLNVTAFAPRAGGFLEVYTPGRRPALPTVRYARSVSAINSAFVAPGVSSNGEQYTVRVYSSQATRVLVEVTGVVAGFPPVSNPAGAAAGQRRLTRQAKQRERLVKSIRNR